MELALGYPRTWLGMSKADCSDVVLAHLKLSSSLQGSVCSIVSDGWFNATTVDKNISTADLDQDGPKAALPDESSVLY
jgi:hypothetical protein